jgi:hypothetical protein
VQIVFFTSSRHGIKKENKKATAYFAFDKINIKMRQIELSWRRSIRILRFCI